MKFSRHRVLIVGLPPAQMLDVTGPLEVFAMANRCCELAGAPAPYEIGLAGPRAGALATGSGVALLAAQGLDGSLRGLDTLLVAGGAGARAAVKDRALVARLAAACARVPRVGSICTGAFALAATGLLDGRRATTHWAHFDEFAALFPAVHIERDALFVRDGRFHSSAGISAGIDSALAMVEEDLGRALALQVARGLVVFLKRPGGQSQFSAQLSAEAAAGDADRFGELTRWMAAHLRHDLSVERLAERVAMSPRNFARRFAETLRLTPARYVQLLRLDAARRLLTDGNAPIPRIAERCGFASAEAMRLAFQRHLNVAPSEFRARFCSTAGADAGRFTSAAGTRR
jgi:transcriptional regulator GlxA family with amidase domain